MVAVFERADLTGLPCYRETERPELVAYYRHHGTEVRSEWNGDLDATQGKIGPICGA
ncbi:hypothetical protein [uncultured Ilumatobacter sp.]|uniref:hypothetical protein n=1 Tax=uncultured Ilumatobacter sp. TaxID=879968 RepID=UPI00374F49BD